MQILQTLISAGCNLELRDRKYGWTSLSWCCRYKQYNAAVKMLQSGADVDAKDRYGTTPLMITVQNGNLELSKYLVINGGADLDMQDAFGTTALMHAIDNSHTNIGRMLIKCGANLNIRDNQLSTALHYAASEGYTQMVSFLLDYGSIPAARDTFGDNAAESARVRGHTEAAQLVEAALRVAPTLSAAIKLLAGDDGADAGASKEDGAGGDG